VRRQSSAHRRTQPEPISQETRTPSVGPTNVRGSRNWWQLAGRIRHQVANTNLALLAAGTAFWAVLSIFPAIIAMITIYGIVAKPDQVTKQVTKLGGSLSASTRDVITKWLSDLTNSSHRGLGIGFVIGLVAVLWAVSSGVQTLIKAISAAYEQEESRGFVRLRGLALLISIGVVILAILVVTAIGLAPALSHLVHNTALRVGLDVAEWIVLGAILAGAIAVLYRFAPAQTPADWRWASAGALFSTFMVVAASIGFSFYVRYFGHYNKTYGALGGVVILMLWLYYCVYVVLLGALLDAEAQRQMTGDTSLETYPTAAPDNVRGTATRDRN
jgi:membrane protein